jgi:hypothetical protein
MNIMDIARVYFTNIFATSSFKKNNLLRLECMHLVVSHELPFIQQQMVEHG